MFKGFWFCDHMCGLVKEMVTWLFSEWELIRMGWFSERENSCETNLRCFCVRVLCLIDLCLAHIGQREFFRSNRSLNNGFHLIDLLNTEISSLVEASTQIWVESGGSTPRWVLYSSGSHQILLGCCHCLPFVLCYRPIGQFFLWRREEIE